MKVTNFKAKNADITLVGTKHAGENRDKMIELVRSEQPELICVEARLNYKIENENELHDAIRFGEEIGTEIWRIDLYENGEFLEIAREELTHEDWRIFGSEMPIQEQRDELKKSSSRLFEHNLNRESTMFAAVKHALNNYRKIMVVVGRGHYIQINSLLRSL